MPPSPRPSGRPPPGDARAPVDRFRHLDAYRVDREWQRYEGTPQRELFLELRRRFLTRHPGPGGRVVDLGSGPGRFTAELGRPGDPHVAVDLSREALGRIPDDPAIDRIRADARRPPLASGTFALVALLGNALGFAGEEGGGLLEAAEALVRPGGLLLVEIAPGPGERSRYLARLPPRVVARLLRAPVGAAVPRVEREGFDPEPARKRSPGTFARWEAPALLDRWSGAGWVPAETIAVAPGLGPDAARLEAVRADPKAWGHLLELEERLGRPAPRWKRAAAVLLAVERPTEKRRVK